MQKASVSLCVWGDYACFSRPEFKVERVSYPIITPSAARGVLEAVFWKPEFRYQIRRIGVVKMGSQMAILRNELNDRQGKNPINIDDSSNRAQRSSLILKDVEYIIEADIVLRPHTKDHVKKYFECFQRRLDKGQYHHTPCLGTREFAADFEPVNGKAPDTSLNRSIGLMLCEIAYIPDKKRNEMKFRRPDSNKHCAGYANALFFNAEIEKGWLNIPHEKYRELYELEGYNAQSVK